MGSVRDKRLKDSRRVKLQLAFLAGNADAAKVLGNDVGPGESFQRMWRQVIDADAAGESASISLQDMRQTLLERTLREQSFLDAAGILAHEFGDDFDPGETYWRLRQRVIDGELTHREAQAELLACARRTASSSSGTNQIANNPKG